MPTVAEILVETLALSGVRRIYGLPGDSLNGITNTIRTHQNIEWVLVRHEEAAAFAAGAEAHLTKRLAVCAGSCGPGNLHFINGLYDCHRSRVPVLAIAAQIPSMELGTNYFQETYPEQIFKNCSHYCGVVTEVSQMPRLLSIAMRTAVSQSGVAVLVLPGNIATQKTSASPLSLHFPESPSRIIPPDADLDRAANILKSARRVTILAGAGCDGAHASLLSLADRLQSPIVHAFRGKEFIEYDNPYDVGMTGLIGFASGYRAMMHCDALLALGTDFPYPQFYPEKARKIQVDIRGEQIGRRTAVEVGIVGSVKETANALLARLPEQKDGAHLKDSLDHYANSRQDLDELAVGKPGTTPLHPEYVTRVIDEVADEDAIFTVDVGTPSVWAARYLHFNGKRRLVGSWSHGSMASALPQALGSQAACPGRQVIALSGDGGLAMLMGELLTAVQNELPIKIVLFNNQALAFVEVEMIAAGILPFGTGLQNPDFSKVAQACGWFGTRVEKPEELKPALQQAFAADGPALVEVLVHRHELSIPPSITAEQALGFGLYLTKSVISGKGDSIIDLAKTNLLNRLFGD